MTTLDHPIRRELEDIVGTGDVLGDPALTERYRTDWTGRFAGPPTIVVRPRDTEAVAAVVERCVAHGVAIVPQGGNTGLVGGSVPLHDEIVVSTEHLDRIENVDATTGAVTAGAGVTIGAVRHAAEEAGWRYGVDLASRDSATVGGTIATNAGGLRVVRYGATRAQLLDCEFVDGIGAVHPMRRATLRDNTGYDLPGLVCGSEGTLGIVTRARLRLVPEYPCRTTALLRFSDPRDAATAVEGLRGRLPSLEAAEIFFAPGLELVCRAFSWPPPFGDTAGGYVLAEVADTVDRTDELAAAVDALTGVSDVAVADDSAARARLWRYRERHTEAIATVGVPHKLDIAVPPGTLADFVDRVSSVVAAADPTATVWLFGHGGEGAIHVNVTGPAPHDDTVDDAVLGLVVDLGGSISAEHGIGTAKLAWARRTEDEAERALRARLKAAFDPHGIMNPAVLIG